MHDTHQQASKQSNTHHAEKSASTRSRLIRLLEVMDRVSLSRTTLYNRMNDGTFPKSVQLGPRAIAWQESSIDEWIADRIKFVKVEEVQS